MPDRAMRSILGRLAALKRSLAAERVLGLIGTAVGDGDSVFHAAQCISDGGKSHGFPACFRARRTAIQGRYRLTNQRLVHVFSQL